MFISAESKCDTTDHRIIQLNRELELRWNYAIFLKINSNYTKVSVGNIM